MIPMTTGRALQILNAGAKVAPKRQAKEIRRGRHHLVRKWLRNGWPIQYTAKQAANPVREGVPISPKRLLTDEPGLMAAIECGAVRGYMRADKAHPATQWLVSVAGVRYSTRSEATARELYHWAVERQRAQLNSLTECGVK